MKPTASWQRYHTGSRVVPRLLWNPKVNFSCSQESPLVPSLSHQNSVQIFTLHFRSILVSSFLLLVFPRGLFHSDFSTTVLYTFLIAHISISTLRWPQHLADSCCSLCRLSTLVSPLSLGVHTACCPLYFVPERPHCRYGHFYFVFTLLSLISRTENAWKVKKKKEWAWKQIGCELVTDGPEPGFTGGCKFSICSLREQEPFAVPSSYIMNLSPTLPLPPVHFCSIFRLKKSSSSCPRGVVLTLKS
jgi:hypothetical protein